MAFQFIWSNLTLDNIERSNQGQDILEEYICRVNMAYMVKLGQLRVNITK